jgi:hypothetical protein
LPDHGEHARLRGPCIEPAYEFPVANAHFPKCRHRRHPPAWSGDLCKEPMTFPGSP